MAMDKDAFAEVLSFVLPRHEDMQWASIPWQTDLWAARQLAADQEKPIFAWMMNGKPLRQIPTE